MEVLIWIYKFKNWEAFFQNEINAKKKKKYFEKIDKKLPGMGLCEYFFMKFRMSILWRFWGECCKWFEWCLYDYAVEELYKIQLFLHQHWWVLFIHTWFSMGIRTLCLVGGKLFWAEKTFVTYRKKEKSEDLYEHFIIYSACPSISKKRKKLKIIVDILISLIIFLSFRVILFKFLVCILAILWNKSKGYEWCA